MKTLRLLPSLVFQRETPIAGERRRRRRRRTRRKRDWRRKGRRQRDKEIQKYTRRASKTTKDWKGWGCKKGIREFMLRSVLEGHPWPGRCPIRTRSKAENDAISCLCADAGLHIPTWEHLLGTTSWQISRQLGSRSICAENGGPPAVGRLQRGRGLCWERGSRESQTV